MTSYRTKFSENYMKKFRMYMQTARLLCLVQSHVYVEANTSMLHTGPELVLDNI